MGNPPVHKIQIGEKTGITLDIWKNEGKKGAFYKYSTQQRYQDKEKNWQTSNSYVLDTIPSLIKGLEEAKRWCEEHPL